MTELLIRRLDALVRDGRPVGGGTPYRVNVLLSGQIAMALGSWDPRGGGDALRAEVDRAERFIAQADPLQDGNDAEYAALLVAQHTISLVRAGDPAALGRYTRWLRGVPVAKLAGNVHHALEPTWRFPDRPETQSFLRWAFHDPGSPFLPLIRGPAARERMLDLLETPLVDVPIFRERVLSDLADRRSGGTLRPLSDNGYTAEYLGWQLSADAEAPLPFHAPVPIRYCDVIAYELTSFRAPKDAPPFRLYWPEAQRDRAIADGSSSTCARTPGGELVPVARLCLGVRGGDPPMSDQWAALDAERPSLHWRALNEESTWTAIRRTRRPQPRRGPLPAAGPVPAAQPAPSPDAALYAEYAADFAVQLSGPQSFDETGAIGSTFAGIFDAASLDVRPSPVAAPTIYAIWFEAVAKGSAADAARTAWAQSMAETLLILRHLRHLVDVLRLPRRHQQARLHRPRRQSQSAGQFVCSHLRGLGELSSLPPLDRLQVEQDSVTAQVQEVLPGPDVARTPPLLVRQVGQAMLDRDARSQPRASGARPHQLPEPLLQRLVLGDVDRAA